MRWYTYLTLLVFQAAIPGNAQNGSAYQHLKPDQKRIVERWVREYEKITGKRVEVAAAYDRLSLSTRSTFDAVTNALAQTTLTDEKGAALGHALDLVEMIESLAGHVPGARGDHQFRVYVLLKPDALTKLYASREFHRVADNTIYHAGYPLNFRQQGGEPSMQFSVTRTGRRADIDIDYRKSGGPTALFNGHLTAANSDVRAGQNFFTYQHRWEGLVDWWKALFHLAEGELTPDRAVTLEESAQKLKTPEKIDDAVHEFLETWLVRGNVRNAQAYFSPASYSCLADFGDGATVDSPLARVRILSYLERGKARVGEVRSLSERIRPIKLDIPNAKPAPNAHEKSFVLEHLRDDGAFEMDCRQRFHTDVAYRMERPEQKYSDYYSAAHTLPGLNGQIETVYWLFGKEEGQWRVISWHLEHPLRPGERIRAAAPPPPERAAAAASADPALVTAIESFLFSWLVRSDTHAAAQAFAPESLACGPEAGAEGTDAKALEHWLKHIGHQSGKGKTVGEHIAPVTISHRDVRPVKQANGSSYLLAAVSDELAAMHACKDAQVAQAHSTGTPKFTARTHVSSFTFRTARGHGGVLNFVWAPRDGGWKIVGFYITT